MGVSIQDRTDFLNMLDACRTEQQLFSRLTFAVMFHQTDPDAREDLLDDVRGAACNMQLPAVNYKIDQWLNTCKQAWQADPAAFMAAVNADAKQRKLALEGSAAQPGLLADVPMQSVAWLVPQLLPLGEVSLLGADGGTGKGIWQAQLIAYVTAGKTSGFFPLPPQQTGKVLLLAGEDDPGKVLKGRIAAAGADMSKVMVVSADDYYLRTGHQLCIGDDDITTFVAKINPILLILDPLQSFLPPDVEMASRNQMRGAVLPLKSLSTKYHLATLISMHTNKRPGVSGRGRLADSSDLWDIARSVLMMGRCKNSTEGQIYLSHEKSSYSKPAQTVLMHIEDVTVDGVPTARAIFDGSTDKKDVDFMEERRLRLAQTKDDTTAAILNALAESRLGSMASSELRAAVTKEVGCSEKTYNRAYAELVKSGRITKKAIRERDGCNRWYSFSDWSKSDDQLKK